MAVGYDRDELFVLAFDHRGSFQKKMFGIEGAPTPEQTQTISDAKALIFDGFIKALDEGVDREAAGMLVDEQFGADLLRRGKKEGVVVAMPVEKSGQDEFDFQYGDEFGAHIEEFDPTFAKVLVRYNPEGDREMNATQLRKLEQLCTWLHDRDRKFLFELLVPAEPAQLESVGGDTDRFDRELRPALMLQAIRDCHERGVEPDVWKIEGLDRREDCQAVAELARSGGRDQVACVVLGRGADDQAVAHWLQQGAGVPGYIGFAIGRTIWWGALKSFLDGGLSREDAAAQIASTYRRFIDVYRNA